MPNHARTDRSCVEYEHLLESDLPTCEQTLAIRSPQTRQLVTAMVIGTTLFTLARWYTQPASKTSAGTLLDRFLPNAEFNGAVSVVIHASPGAIFQALREVTLADMPLAKWLGELRYLPARLTGTATGKVPDTEPFMKLVMAMGTIVLAEVPDRELVVGSVGKYHNLMDQQIPPLHSPEEFMSFAMPDYQKLAMSFRVFGSESTIGYTFTLEHRTHALSPLARWKFMLYWLGIKPGGNFVSWLMLRAIKRRAEILAVTPSVVIQ